MLKQKKKELKTLHEQKENLHDLLEQGVYNIETFMERQKKLADRIREAENEIVKMKEEIARVEEEEKKQEEFVPRVKTVLEAYQTTDDVEKKNRLLKSIIERIDYTRPQGSGYGEFTIEVTLRF